MDIKINNSIGNFKAYLISPEGENLGLITNIISLDNVRLQIKRQKANGYKILFNNEYITIDHCGSLEKWPDELCYYTDILMNLL